MTSSKLPISRTFPGLDPKSILKSTTFGLPSNVALRSAGHSLPAVCRPATAASACDADAHHLARHQHEHRGEDEAERHERDDRQGRACQPSGITRDHEHRERGGGARRAGELGQRDQVHQRIVPGR